jgi:hypothetical protein
VLRFAVELLPCLLLGLGLGIWRPGLPARLAPPLVHWGVPISMVGLLLIGEAAEARGRRGEAAPAAALVLWSTLAALVTVPLWGLLLARLPPG